MKKRLLLLMIGGVFLVSTLLSMPTNILAMSVRQRQIFDSGIPYYNVDTLCDLNTGSVGTLPGKNNQEKVWNFLAQANIPGVSDNAAVIAGIMGNLQQESGFQPFSTNGTYYGIFQTSPDPMIQFMNSHGMSITRSDFRSGVSESDPRNDQALQLQLQYLTQVYSRFIADSSASYGFLKNLDQVTNTTGVAGAHSYADLFLVAVEGAFNGDGSNTLTDQVVVSYAKRIFPGYSFGQGAEQRRAFAETIFNEYAALGSNTPSNNAGCPPTSGSGDITNTAILYSWPEGNPNVGSFNPKPEYLAAMKQVEKYTGELSNNGCASNWNGASCDVFVATVYRNTVDPDFPCCGTDNILANLKSNPKYEMVVDGSKRAATLSDLRSGDILILSGHVVIYVKLPNGADKVASASCGERTADHANNVFFSDRRGNYYVFRWKGGG